MQAKWWHPENFSEKYPNLKLRAQIIREIRRFFDNQGFDAVETPILQTCPVIDTHIRAFASDLRGIDGEIQKTMYLHTSPEFDMKKLMVAGCEKIYQICHVFRNAEGSKRHSPEFTMIEWYRTNADYNDIMQDCVELLKVCASAAAIQEYKHGNKVCNPFAEAEKITVSEAFEKAVQNLGLHTADDDKWDDLFFRVMDEKIEPNLGIGRPTFLCDYPIAMASLSKPKESDPRFAERFELYVCGIELANAFSELTDAEEQLRRYHIEIDQKEKLYEERYPLDEEFIEALRLGMPPSGGIALGIDRLIMLALGADDISDVLWAPININ
ncbi:MAG: EF-P lysine aminoacylase EpmA [Pseudomonadota bacterium]